MPQRRKRREDGKLVEKKQWRTPGQEHRAKHGKKPIEARDGELAAEVVFEGMSAGEKIDRFMEVSEACGMPKAMALALKKRMETRYIPATETLRNVQTSQLINYLDDRALKALEYMDDAVFAEANLRDLAVSMGILIEKRQLLRGEPTQILSIEERQNVNELIPQIIHEAKRRGMTIDSYPTNGNDEEGQATTVYPDPQDRAHIDSTYRRLTGFPKDID